jgi:pyruvate dehydrogenase E2 component (dihydrolipoamide acetyltransferase)
VAEFLLPDVGEGLTEAEIVTWRVAVGDQVAVNDVVVEIETAKSLVELPVPFAGTVTALLVPEGVTVPVGTAIIAVATADEPAQPAGAPPGPARAAGPAPVPAAPDVAEPAAPAAQAVGEPPLPPAEPAREPVLVGYGPRSGPVTRRARRGTAPPAAPEAAAEALNATFAATTHAVPPTPAAVLAKPPVRKLARDLGIDLSTVQPSGPGGTVTRADVEGARSRLAAPVSGRSLVAAPPGWDDLPREERQPIRSVRKATAQAVTASAFTAPHVTEWVDVDVTRTVRLVRRLRRERPDAFPRLSPLAVVARAACLAVRRTPEVNARWDDEAAEIVLQRYVNLGIAAATPRGLVVPNVKDAHRLDLAGLAAAISDLAATARAGRTPPTDMVGGTFTITNVGVFGVDGGTPILPRGESAILCVGAFRQRPWVHRGRVRPREVATLSLSFDHRLVDGEQGSRFLADVAALLDDPAMALAWN